LQKRFHSRCIVGLTLFEGENSLYGQLGEGAMRRVTTLWEQHLTLILSVGLAACAAPANIVWEKAGVTESAKAADTSDCRSEARSQAARLYPYYANPPGSDTPTAGGAQHHDERGQVAAENRDFVRCMRNKGYERVSPKKE
jgi:hypothetical protein